MPWNRGAITSTPSTTTVGSTIAQAYQWRSKLRRNRLGSRVVRRVSGSGGAAGAGVRSVVDMRSSRGECRARLGERGPQPRGSPPAGPVTGPRGRRDGSLSGVVRDHVALVLRG